MRKCKTPQISLLVPFKPDPFAPSRSDLWKWLKEYWKYELPDAEIVIGTSYGPVFSKTQAINNAAKKARGRVFVILDADTYMPGEPILQCAREIDESLRRGHPLWFVPYRRLYRLTPEATIDVLLSSPKTPIRFHTPPLATDVEGTEGSMHGHRFGALIQIMPREAFELIGGMETRMTGWGGEDVAFVRALDTLYSPHKTTKNDVLHLWHAKIGDTTNTRMWQGQVTPLTNANLASRYNKATGDRVRMRALVDEAGLKPVFTKKEKQRLYACLGVVFGAVTFCSAKKHLRLSLK